MNDLDAPCVHVTLDGQPCSLRWLSETGAPPPKTVVLADDTISADRAYRLACEGTGLLWQGDYQNARQLLQALGRRMDKRMDKRPQRKPAPAVGAADGHADITQVFHLHRKAQWRLDFISAENSMGFHAPQEAARILGESINLARQGQIELLKAGFTAAKLSGGISSWKADNLPLVK